MDALPFLISDAQSISRGVVVRGTNDCLIVSLSGESGTDLVCDRLYQPGGPEADYAAGDVVLVWACGEGSVPVVLGRVGRSSVHAERAVDEAPVPDELVLEAKQQLTLRVGDGSITLRADGKIQIKGKDLVSHAQRLNRIKGGAVSIN